MNVTCPDCRTVYRVDPRKVPAGGVLARCARCPAEIAVYVTSEAAPDVVGGPAVAEQPAVSEQDAVAVVAAEVVADLEPTVAEGLDAADSDVEVTTAVSAEWVEPTAAEVTEMPSEGSDQSWLIRGSAWVDQISARMDEPAAASTDAFGDEARADDGASVADVGHDTGAISVSVDFNPEASDYATDAASETQDGPAPQETVLAGAVEEMDTSATGYDAYAEDRWTGESRYEAEYETAAYSDSADGEGDEVGVVASDGGFEEPTAEAGAHENGGGGYATDGGDMQAEAEVVASTGDYSPYDADSTENGGYETVAVEAADDALTQEGADYEVAAHDDVHVTVDDAGSTHDAVEYGAGGYDHEGDQDRESEYASTAETGYASAYSESDAQDRMEVEAGADASLEYGGEGQPYAAAFAGDATSTESAAHDEYPGAEPVGTAPDEDGQSSPSAASWTASHAGESEAEEASTAPVGGLRDREAVVVSATAGSIDAAVGGVTGSAEGEGFTAVPPRSDEDIPLPPSPFGLSDPHARAKRLARALVSDIVVYNPDRRERSIRMGTVRQEFREEIRKSWEEYVAHVGNQMARETTYFRDALNELLAGGQRLF